MTDTPPESWRVTVLGPRARIQAALVAHEDAVLEAEASNPAQQKARELGVDPLWAPDRKAATAAAFAAAPRFLLLDFRCGRCLA